MKGELYLTLTMVKQGTNFKIKKFPSFHKYFMQQATSGYRLQDDERNSFAAGRLVRTAIKMINDKSYAGKRVGAIKQKNRLGTVVHAYNPSTLGGRGGWITRSRDRDQDNQQGETPSLLKIQKLAGHGGACL